MQAVVLAAGMGKRLGALTKNQTDCMVSLHGTTLIERSLDALVATATYDCTVAAGASRRFEFRLWKNYRPSDPGSARTKGVGPRSQPSARISDRQPSTRLC
jgi:2-C-methyl-D-erythritol 4-phosphate cytidylyltransferase